MSGLDSIPGAGLLVDAERRIQAGNGRCVIVFEADSEELQGKRLADLEEMGLCESASLERWERAVLAVLGGEASEVHERVTLSPGGTEHVYDLTVTPATRSGEPEAACCSLREVGTNREYDETLRSLHAATRTLMRAETFEEVLHRTAEAASEVLGFPGTGVRRYDPGTGLLHHVSFGSRIEEIESRPPYHVEESPHGRAIRRGETVIDKVEQEDPYDREVFTQTMYVPIGSRGLLSVGTVGRSFDESDIQFAEILAENAAAALQVVTTAERLRQEQQHLELLRQILTRVLRHNIRNDVNVIESNAELIDEMTDDSVSEHVELICESVESVTSLSEKAREIERILDEPPQPREIDLAAVLDRAVTRVQTEYPGARIETAVPDSCRVATHRSLGLALRNLLENACKHTDDGPASVDVRVTRGDTTVRISIADDGPGIPTEEVEVLDREVETALRHGSGLGLWIVKWVIERSDANIAFDASDGTRVDITIPSAGGEQADVASGPGPGPER